MSTQTNCAITKADEAISEMSSKQRSFIVKLTILISGGMLIDGFILGSMGIVMPAITKDLELSSLPRSAGATDGQWFVWSLDG